ncbi:hypothetical protein [Tianweitania sp.]|uniref:hypothetical protein n=1 Tax=Tianweitania sp. TaxID=2021634 RepID=UPI00289DAE7E|nr:hypothetical protein [Tianweitania sp.]
MESLLAELPEWARNLFYIVLAVGGGVMFIYGRNRPAPSASLAPGVAAIGMELGNKEQVERLIAAVNRIGDILADKKQHEMDDKLDELLEKMSHLPDQRR